MSEPMWQYENRSLLDDERGLLMHISRWGSDGYPVRKYRTDKWSWDFRGLHAPTVYGTKRAAMEALERYLDVLRELTAREAYARALAKATVTE